MSADPAESDRRKSVEIAIADSRIEGLPPPSGWELEILNAFIRGEIEAKDLVEAVKAGQRALMKLPDLKFNNSAAKIEH